MGDVLYRIVIIDTALIEVESEKKKVRYPYAHPALFQNLEQAIAGMREILTSGGDNIITEIGGKYPSALWFATSYRNGMEVGNAGIHKVINRGSFVEYRSFHIVIDNYITIYPSDRSRLVGVASNLNEALMVVDSMIAMAYL